MSGSYRGACFCGAVEMEVTGQPNAMGYCHCRSCRSWSAGPVNAFTLWPPEAVKVTKGEQYIVTYHKTDLSHRQFCRLCGGHLMTRHLPLKMVDVYAATIPDLVFAPQLVHVRLCFLFTIVPPSFLLLLLCPHYSNIGPNIAHSSAIAPSASPLVSVVSSFTLSRRISRFIVPSTVKPSLVAHGR